MPTASVGPITRRYVFGPGTDEPLVWYEGSGTIDRRWLYQDERGSVVATAGNDGQKLAVNTYDEFGIPGANNQGRYQYTGQTWLPLLGMYNYKARIYSPTLGRFLQTDPIGYGDGINWYNYVGGDPINRIDPSGLAKWVFDCSKAPSGEAQMACAIAAGNDASVQKKVEFCETYRDACEMQVDGPRIPASEVPRATEPVPNTGSNAGQTVSSGGGGEGATQKEEPKPRDDLKKYNPKVNYCGGTGGQSLPNNVGGAGYNEACYRHDVCYSGSGISRAQCDATFGIEVAALIGYRGIGRLPLMSVPGSSLFLGASAWLIVRLGGGQFYEPKR